MSFPPKFPTTQWAKELLNCDYFGVVGHYAFSFRGIRSYDTTIVPCDCAYLHRNLGISFALPPLWFFGVAFNTLPEESSFVASESEFSQNPYHYSSAFAEQVCSPPLT
jgi:hypothetical protein